MMHAGTLAYKEKRLPSLVLWHKPALCHFFINHTRYWEIDPQVDVAYYLLIIQWRFQKPFLDFINLIGMYRQNPQKTVVYLS